ncbi:MAG: hypothetical protein ACYS22_16780, partial [Planctomycetota bacterium]
MPPAPPREPGSKQAMRYERTVTLEVGTVPILPEIMAAGGRTAFRPDAQIYPAFETPDLLERGLARLLEQNELTKVHQELRKALIDDVHRKGGFFQLDRMAYAERNPLRAHRVGEDIAGRLRTSASLGFSDLSAVAFDLIDANTAPRSPGTSTGGDVPPAPTSAEQVLDHVEAIFDRAEALRAEAFAALSGDELQLLADKGDELVAAVTVTLLVDWRGQPDRESNLQIIRVARKVRFDKLAAMAQALAPLWDPQTTRAWATAIASAKPIASPSNAGVSGTVLGYRKTAHGAFVIGGPNANVYDGAFAFTLDIGGDDVHQNDCGTGWLGGRAGIGCTIDIAGNDRYDGAKRLVAQGCGWLGAGLLIDLAGDDTYEVARIGQGAGYFGFGLLLDAGGKDTYRSDAFVQGAGLFGVGALIDLGNGDDVYEAKLLAQGFAGPKGLGLSYDQDGDDRYTCGGTYPSSYGTKDVYRGHGQGMAIGFRHAACGGIGVLLDGAGNDTYTAGNFSQATGYYMALGVLADDKGNDTYNVTRYGQG